MVNRHRERLFLQQRHSSVLVLACVALAGCVQQTEHAEQKEAVEYTVNQHYSAECAGAGFLPGSDPFAQCMAKLSSAGR